MTLQLAAGRYRGLWWNPIDGATPSEQPIEPFDWKGGQRSFEAPANRNTEGAGDWVLYVHGDAPERH